MVKILGGALGAVLIAVAAYFGFQFYVQQRALAEVDSAFAALRAAGAKADHGKVSFETSTRTVTVADITLESGSQPPATVKISRFTATGVKEPQPGRFAADRIVADGVDVAATMALQEKLQFAYRAPQVEIVNYAGPAAALRRPDPAVPGDLYRVALEHFAAVSATSITAATVSGSMTAPSTSGMGAGEYTYSGLAMRDIRDGRIATMTIDRLAFSSAVQVAGKADKMTGDVVNLAASDFDANATLALFDPAKANDDKYYRGYREMKTGAYSISMASGMKFRLDGMSATEIGMKPSKLQFPKLMAIMDAVPAPGTTPTQDQLRDLMEKTAGIYEGVGLGGAELRGLAFETPEGPVRLAAVKIGKLENGKFAEIAFEGLDARAPQGPVTVGRFALRSLDIAKLMRTAGTLSNPNPSPEDLASLLLLLEGMELRGLVAPYKDTGDPVRVETMTLGWGQFVGSIPTKLRAVLKMSGPVDATDPDPFNMLADAGMKQATINLDVGTAWNEPARSFALEPMTFEMDGLFAAAARASVSNVPREAFTLNPLMAAVMAAQIEAGPIEIALRDTGGIDLAIAHTAKTENIDVPTARTQIIEGLREGARELAEESPEARTILDAFFQWIENPRSTMTVKLAPKGKVVVMELMQTANTDPPAALARFEVTAKVTK